MANQTSAFRFRETEIAIDIVIPKKNTPSQAWDLEDYMANAEGDTLGIVSQRGQFFGKFSSPTEKSVCTLRMLI